MKIYLIVGEPSGDILASRLINAIRAKRPETEFFGIGGETMRAEGFRSLFDIKCLSVMGVMEVIPRLPVILRRKKEILADIEKIRPDVIVSVDSWGFVNSILKKLKRQGCTIPKIHYVAPQVWAWKKGRAKKASKLMNHLMTLLPYEPPYFEKYGLACTFVGHPVVENTATFPEVLEGNIVASRTSASVSHHHENDHHRAFPEALEGNIPVASRLREPQPPSATARILCVLPGSRHSEVSKLAPVFVESIKQIQKKIPNLFLLIPSVETMKDEIDKHFRNIGIPYRIITGQNARYEAFRMSEFAIATSGTVSLELAVCRTPHLIAYTFNWLTNRIVKLLVKTKYANLINILADRAIIPEFVLRRCRADLIASEALDFLQNKEKCASQIEQAGEQLAKLKPADKLPSEKASEVVLGIV